MHSKRLDTDIQREERRIATREADSVTLALRLVEHLLAGEHGPDAIERTVVGWMQAQALDPHATRAVVARLQSRLSHASFAHVDEGLATWRRRAMQDQVPSIGSGRAPVMARGDAWQTRMVAAAQATRVQLDAFPAHYRQAPHEAAVATGHVLSLNARPAGVHALQLAARDGQVETTERLRDVAPEAVLARLGSGRPLPERLQRALAPRLEALGQPVDLARVRVHDDGEAETLCSELHADGFAIGHHVVLGTGPLREDLSSLGLLVHELTHVWQQAHGAAGQGFEAAPHLEARAEHAAAMIRNAPEIDESRAQATERLVAEYSHALGLDPATQDVRDDAEAAATVRARGLAGLMQDGEIQLDPTYFDPATHSGKALLAHEMVHVAQRDLSSSTHHRRNPAAAEVEAHTLGARIAAGAPIASPQVALGQGDAAGCGPMEMNERRTEPEPEPEPVPQRVPEVPPGETTQTVTEPPVYRIVQNRIEIPLIQYHVDKDRITETEPDARPIMRQLADTLKMYPEITKVRIEGFTSTTGSNEHNLALSQRRADHTREWLQNEEGVQQVAFETRGHGENASRLRVQTGDGVENDQNRRTEITIVEVEGRPAPPNWHPTRKVLVSPGRTIIRHLDAEGRVVREEVVASNDQPAGASTQGHAAGTNTPAASSGAPARA
jgi:outer membrane protein OmpA-like peptidoglycan-associated protein